VCTNRRRRNYVESLGSNFKLTPALSYDLAIVPSKVHSCAEHGTATESSRRLRTGSCAAGGGPPVSFGTTCALLRAWAPPRVSGSDEHDAQPQKIYTTRQILHLLPELHGGVAPKLRYPWTRRADEFYGGNFARANSIGKIVLKIGTFDNLCRMQVSLFSEVITRKHRATLALLFSETCGFIVRRAGKIAT